MVQARQGWKPTHKLTTNKQNRSPRDALPPPTAEKNTAIAICHISWAASPVTVSAFSGRAVRPR